MGDSQEGPDFSFAAPQGENKNIKEIGGIIGDKPPNHPRRFFPRVTNKQAKAMRDGLRATMEKGLVLKVPGISDPVVADGEVEPILIDNNGYSVPPPTINTTGRNGLNSKERKDRFIRFYNWSFGNLGFAAQEAGVQRQVIVRQWMNDPQFLEKLKEVEESIVDRLYYYLLVKLGVLKHGKVRPINEAIIVALIKRFKPDFFMGLETESQEPEDAEKVLPTVQVPRPTRPSGVQPQGQQPNPG